MDEKRLGQRIGSARRSAGFTQQTLCQKANLSYSTLAKIERGAIKAPSIFTIESIAVALGISLESLIGTPTQSKAKGRSESGVSFVYFDVNGCLVHFFHSAFTKLAEMSGQPADIVETLYWHYNDQVCRGEIKLDAFNKILAKALKIDTINWKDYYFAAVHPVPDMAKLLEWVASKYRIGLLTNTMPGFLEQLIDQGFVPDISYDSIVDSSKVGAIKPEKKIYEIAKKQADCNENEILLIDDSRTNLMAAEKLGWHVTWFDDYNSTESITRIRESLQPVNGGSTTKERTKEEIQTGDFLEI